MAKRRKPDWAWVLRDVEQQVAGWIAHVEYLLDGSAVLVTQVRVAAAEESYPTADAIREFVSRGLADFVVGYNERRALMDGGDLTGLTGGLPDGES